MPHEAVPVEEQENLLSPQYCAGFFDGEGCVQIVSRGKNNDITLRLWVINLNKEVLLRLAQRFGGTCIDRKIYGKTRLNSRPSSAWQVSGANAHKFLLEIHPYAIVKKKQIDLGLEFLEFKALPRKVRCHYNNPRGKFSNKPVFLRRQETIQKETEFYIQMRVLNKRGVNA